MEPKTILALHTRKVRFYDRWVLTRFVLFPHASRLFTLHQPSRPDARCGYFNWQEAKAKPNDIHVASAYSTREDLRADALSRWVRLSTTSTLTATQNPFRCLRSRRTRTESWPHRVTSAGLVPESSSKVPSQRALSHELAFIDSLVVNRRSNIPSKANHRARQAASSIRFSTAVSAWLQQPGNVSIATGSGNKLAQDSWTSQLRKHVQPLHAVSAELQQLLCEQLSVQDALLNLILS